MFIDLIRQLVLRLKCQSTEIVSFGSSSGLILSPLALALTAERIIFGSGLARVTRSPQGLVIRFFVVLRLSPLLLLIVREGVNLLVDGEEILFVRCEFHIVVLAEVVSGRVALVCEFLIGVRLSRRCLWFLRLIF